MTHIGFTGTRFGMTSGQKVRTSQIVDMHDDVVVHHGCCRGADEEFSLIANERCCTIIGHPGPPSEWTSELALRLSHEVHQPETYMKRNRAIVEASSVVIATPFQDAPQLSGGTWRTIIMALDGFRIGRPIALYVVGRDGNLLDHTKWVRP